MLVVRLLTLTFLFQVVNPIFSSFFTPPTGPTLNLAPPSLVLFFLTRFSFHGSDIMFYTLFADWSRCALVLMVEIGFLLHPVLVLLHQFFVPRLSKLRVKSKTSISK